MTRSIIARKAVEEEEREGMMMERQEGRAIMKEKRGRVREEE